MTICWRFERAQIDTIWPLCARAIWPFVDVLSAQIDTIWPLCARAIWPFVDVLSARKVAKYCNYARVRLYLLWSICARATWPFIVKLSALKSAKSGHNPYLTYTHVCTCTYICTDTVNAICLGEWQSKAIHTMYIMFILSHRNTHIVTHLLSERVLFTHWMGVVLIHGILAHWNGVVLFFSHFYASMHNTNAQKQSQVIT